MKYMNTNKYKSFAGWTPKDSDFDYDTRALKNDSYQIKGRFDKRNPDFKEFCKKLRNERKHFKIIDQNRTDYKVDVWVKKL